MEDIEFSVGKTLLEDLVAAELEMRVGVRFFWHGPHNAVPETNGQRDNARRSVRRNGVSPSCLIQ